jgi:hypothetical protein
MKLITSKTPGVILDGGDLCGRIVVLRMDGSMPRLQARKLQLAKAQGGNGCKPDAIGTGVFVFPMWVEDPESTGKLRRTSGAADDAEHTYKTERNRIIGVASDALIAEVSADPDTIPPGDINDLCVLAACDGRWAIRDTVAEALKAIGKRSTNDVSLAVVHREAYINDMGYMCTPRCYEKPGRENVQWLSGHEGTTRSTKAAEELAAKLIAAARG